MDADVDVDEVIDGLYGLPPARFTAARSEAAARVKAAGDPAAAKRIAGLRRPTLAAWASNTLVRAKPEEVEQFLQLGEALRAAHRSLDGDQLRELSHQQHVVIGALAREALRLTEEAGAPVSETVVREVEQILHAVLADPEAAGEWASGRLAKAPALMAEFPAVDPGAVPSAPPRRARVRSSRASAGPSGARVRSSGAPVPPSAEPATAPEPEPYDGRLEAARADAAQSAWAAAAREDERRLANEARRRAAAEAAAADAARDHAHAAAAAAEERYNEADRAARDAALAAAAAERRLRELSGEAGQDGGDG
ncbi:hypothetical protein MTF65_04940 [Streptomyces sp. APSN-46.1]|uniref:hypothetical protein n=1 Tax=Streptomyces sp. APSN-46.1 TaxID=2929049 RepID=UPI001FB1F449|nr:hypothetical protein [Streptomyces sp. APSN-46.1]MCJ1676702.1 hypothetical protein [Streptomyces sp. APSN-46.1]